MINSNRSAAIRTFSRETNVGISSVRIVVRPLDRTWRIWEEGIGYATKLTAKSRRIRDEDGRRWGNRSIAIKEDDHRDIDFWLTYRSNSYARSRARMPAPKPYKIYVSISLKP